ncbi:MAG TPA: O-antigen ligase family protein [Candidatus Binatia bacterium]|nr:O-antigen ligase family protein [Candidatus Binatia bacterium]
MMRSADSSNNLAFALLLAFLFLIDISIAGCYILLTLILLLAVLHLLRGGKFPRLPFFCVFFGAYILFTLLATVFSQDRAASIADNKELLIFLLIPIYLWLLDSWKRVWLSIWTVLAAGVFSAMIGIVSVLKKGISLSARLQGFTSHWMTYAGLLMFVFIFFFVLLVLRRRADKAAFIIGASLIILLSAIAFSLTRNVWLGIGSSLLLFLIFFRPRYVLVVAPALVILALIAPLSVRSRVLSIVDLKDSGNRERIYMVYSGLKIAVDHPWTGVGANNVAKVIAANPARYKHPQAREINLHLHNNFLQILAERGIFALASFLLACLFIILQLLKKLKSSSGDRRVITAGTLFAFAGFLVAGLFEYNFGDSEIKFILFYFLILPFLDLKEDDHVQIEKN